MISDSADGSRPLVVTAEPALLDELLRLCEVADVEPTVAADHAALHRYWAGASVVLLGADLADLAGQLPQRARVVLVGSSPDPLWQLAAQVRAEHVAVLPAASAWLLGLLTASPDPARLAPVIAVMGGQGGAGATTLTAALGRQASSTGVATLLVDADPYGGGIDLALGLETAAGDRWPDLSPDGEPEDTPGLLDRLPSRGGLRLLSTDRERPRELAASTVESVLSVGRRCCDLVLVDLPRRLDPVNRGVLAQADAAYLVVPAQVRAVAAAAQLALVVREHTRDLRAVIRGPAPSGLSLAGISRSLGIPVAGAARAEPGLARSYELGIPPGQARGPLARLCAQLLTGVAAAPGAGRAAA